jgi:hypothetical protein
MLVAAAPAWLADNVAQIAIGTLAVVTGLVVWVVQRTVLRMALLGVMVAMALFIYVNREPLRACAQTCECRIADRDITVPACSPDLEL